MKRKSVKERLTIISPILNAFLFLLGSLQLFESGNYLLGGLMVLAAALHLLYLLFRKRIQIFFELILLVINVPIALLTALAYYQSGTQYLHLAWILVAVLSAVAGVVLWVVRTKRTSIP